MAEQKSKSRKYTFTLKEALHEFSDEEAVDQLDELIAEKGELWRERILTPVISVWETIADRKRDVDSEALRNALFDPFIERIESKELVCSGLIDTTPPNIERQKIPAERIRKYKLDFWNCVATRREDNVTLTHVEIESKSAGRSAKRVSRRELEAWYSAYLEGIKAAAGRSNREMDIAAAKDKFGARVTHTMVEDLRREVVDETWRKGGRRPKKA